MKIWCLFNENEYAGEGGSLEAVFDDEDVANKVCAILNEIDTNTPPAQESFYGIYRVEEYEVGSKVTDFAKVWSLRGVAPWAKLLKEHADHPSLALLKELTE